MPLSKRATEILTHLRDDEDPDLICFKNECWCGEEKTSKRVVNELLRLVLISEDSGFGEKVQRYHINEWGLKVLENPRYIRTIVRKLSKSFSAKTH
jgi:hypothetical protein